MEKRRYYSSRVKRKSLDDDDLYIKLQNLYLYFRDKDYFKEKLGITSSGVPDEAKYRAAMALNIQIFPLSKWSWAQITEDNIFDAIEFLFDNVSKP